jgi:anion-transporting  ArsA/GET3 family ATPase
MRSPFDLKFVFVVGKGGVGKSAVSAALALAAAKRGKRVLVAMCNAKERLSYLLETPPIGPQIQRILPNLELDAVNMEPGAALEEYGMLILKVRALYKVIFENRFVAAFLRGTPGLEAWAMLGKAQYHALEKGLDGRDRYDLVIVDAPATGHGLDLLRVPRVIIDVAPPGLLRREAERAYALFRDQDKAGVLLVSIPEEMPATETIELHDAIRGELELPVCGLVVNQTLPALFDARDLPIMSRLTEELPEDHPLAVMARTGRARAEREKVQRASVDRMSEQIHVPSVQLPQILVDDFRRKEIDRLGDVLHEGFSPDA